MQGVATRPAAAAATFVWRTHHRSDLKVIALVQQELELVCLGRPGDDAVSYIVHNVGEVCWIPVPDIVAIVVGQRRVAGLAEEVTQDARCLLQLGGMACTSRFVRVCVRILPERRTKSGRNSRAALGVQTSQEC